MDCGFNGQGCFWLQRFSHSATMAMAMAVADLMVMPRCINLPVIIPGPVLYGVTKHDDVRLYLCIEVLLHSDSVIKNNGRGVLRDFRRPGPSISRCMNYIKTQSMGNM
jgi:hypothetical protein